MSALSVVVDEAPPPDDVDAPPAAPEQAPDEAYGEDGIIYPLDRRDPDDPGWTTAPQLANRTPEKVEWVIRGVAAVGSITEVVAPIKAGKSTFIGHAIRALLAGYEFLAEPIVPGADVWWITEERPASLRRLLSRTGLLQQWRLHVLMLQEAAGLTWPDMVASAVAQSRRGDVLVVDTIGRLAGLGGDSENDAGDAQKAMAPLESAAAAGLAVIAGRHSRKAGGDPESAGRGSSAWSGISDIVLQLTKAGASHPATVRKLDSASRFEETPDGVLIQLTNDGYQLLGEEGALAFAEAEATIRLALEDGEMLQADLVKLPDTSGKPLGGGTARRVLDGLQRFNKAEKLGRGGRGDPFRWRLTPVGDVAPSGFVFDPAPDTGSASHDETAVLNTNRGDSATPPNPVALSTPRPLAGGGGERQAISLPVGENGGAQNENPESCPVCGGSIRRRPTKNSDRPWCDACNGWADAVLLS